MSGDDDYSPADIGRSFKRVEKAISELRTELGVALAEMRDLPERLAEKFVLTKVHDLEVGDLRENQRQFGNRLDKLEVLADGTVSKSTVRWVVGICLTVVLAICGVATVVVAITRK